MQVRAAQIGDAQANAEIHVRTWPVAYPDIVPAEYLASLSVEKYEAMWHDDTVAGKPQPLVATEADCMLGWVAFGPSRDEGVGTEVAEIWAIYVDAEHWGQGVGRKLWANARSQMRKQGFVSVSLWAFSDNARAGSFYRSLGFEVEPASSKQFQLGGSHVNEVRYARTTDA